MVVQHNMMAMNANRQLGLVTSKKAKNMEKLSSGYKVNRAADDAAGLAISEKMRRQIRGLTQASANAQDGISLVQIADGAMSEVHDMLHRGSELSIKASNGTLSDEDRNYINDEIKQLKEEIDQIKEKTTFNEIKVLKGKDVEITVDEPVNQSAGGAAVRGGLPAWVGVSGSALSDKYMSDTHVTTETYTYVDAGGVTQTGTASVSHSAVTLDFSGLDSQAKFDELVQKDSGFYSTCCTCSNHYSIQFVNGGGNSTDRSGNHFIYKVDIDGATNGTDVVNKIMTAVGDNPNNHFTKLEGNGAKITVYDYRSKAGDPAAAEKASITAAGGDPTTFKWTSWKGGTASADSRYGIFGPGVAYDKQDTPAPKPVAQKQPVDIQLQIGAEQGQLLDIKLPSISCKALKIDETNVKTVSDAQDAIVSFKNALRFVAEERSRMGAYQNRLEHTIKNLDNVVENTTAAESRIRDTDMAKEMVEFSIHNILGQAGQSMLSQANQANSGILSLFG